ncbi:MAG: hypothetical protein Q9187_001222 [Circinaria calcarea]
MACTLPYAQAYCGCKFIPCAQGLTATTASIAIVSDLIQPLNVHNQPARRGGAARTAHETGSRHLVPNQGTRATQRPSEGVREQRIADDVTASRGPESALQQGPETEEICEPAPSRQRGPQGRRSSHGGIRRGGVSQAGKMPATEEQPHINPGPLERSTVAAQEYERAADDGNDTDGESNNRRKEGAEKEYSDDEENANRAKRPRTYRYVGENSSQRDAVRVGGDERNNQHGGIVNSVMPISTFTETDFEDHRTTHGCRPVDSTSLTDQQPTYQKPSVANETDEEFSKPALRGGCLSPSNRDHHLDSPMHCHGRGWPIHCHSRCTPHAYCGDYDNSPVPRRYYTNPMCHNWEDLYSSPCKDASQQNSINNSDATERLRRLAYRISPVLLLGALARGWTVEILVAVMVIMVVMATQVYTRY